MYNFASQNPHEKKMILISLIDDMTAAAVDRSGQGYSQFLQCRSELLKTIDAYIEVDIKRDALAESISHNISQYFEVS